MSTKLPDDLVKAFLGTDYHVLAEAPFILRINMPSPELKDLLDETRTRCAAYLTAWNPHSRPTAESENQENQSALAREIAQGGWMVIPGYGQGRDKVWPAEPSFLVLGIPYAEAERLARHFNQNAFVWCPEDAVPGLVLMR
jgi:hypothetical protein